MANEIGLNHDQALKLGKGNQKSYVSAIGRDEHHNPVSMTQQIVNQRHQNHSPAKIM